MTHIHLIYAEVHLAIAEKGEQWVLDFMRSRKDNLIVENLIKEICNEFHITELELKNKRNTQIINARRILAKLLDELGYKQETMIYCMNTTRQNIWRYVRFMKEIEENDQVARSYKPILQIKQRIKSKIQDGRKN